ncbi:MAG: C40 family peptidase [Dokdonella sp.]|uniref:C40 family peptidase n=1 Tax=Dokdonella sp. TaxID=2291710 RepID=UPI00326431D5
MTSKRMMLLFSLAFLASASSMTQASTNAGIDTRHWQMDSSSTLGVGATPLSGTMLALSNLPALAETSTVPTRSAPKTSGVRKLLADFAVTLRDIRYRRGGREPSTGFDCSGFVRYVFRHTLQQDLPSDSASQYLSGEKVARADMKTGDLVFFRIRGKRISHVGIYLDNGRFIHSPSTGKSVSISNLSEAYWAKHFVGAKRPSGLS